MRKKRALPPRCQRMNRSGRLQSAKPWLKEYQGKNVLRGYCKHFNVDWRCAAIELLQLGVKLDEEYLQQRAVTEANLIEARRKRKESQAAFEADDTWPFYATAFEAYLAEDYAAMHALEQDQWGS